MRKYLAMAGLIAAGSMLSANVEAVEPTISPIFSSRLAVNGVTTTEDGRMFAPVQPSNSGEPQVVEIKGGKPYAFPEGKWNSRDQQISAAERFVGINALRVGPDGALWVVDRGSTGIGQPQLPGAAKLIRIDLSNNAVSKVYDLSSVVTTHSFVDDVRFAGDRAYLTDAGDPAIIVLELNSGKGKRLLAGHPSTVSNKPLRAEGKVLLDPAGHPIVVHVDQLEVSPDEKWLYFQPCSGGMSRIELRFLNNPDLSVAALASHVEFFADTPSTGGTAIDTNGNIYLSDTDASRILKMAPDGIVSTVIEDRRLAWVDAMWIDRHGTLLMPAAQLNRSAGLNHGVDDVQQPISIFATRLNVVGTRN